MPTYLEVARAWSASIRSRDQGVALKMVRGYLDVEARLSREIDDVLKAVEAKKAKGEDVGVSWLIRSDRLKVLRGQVLEQINRFALYAADVTVVASTDAVEEAIARGRELFDAARGPVPAGGLLAAGIWNHLPSEAFEHMVGVLSDGSPVLDHLKMLAPETFDNVAAILKQGIAQGWNPRKTAAHAKEALGLPTYRAEANAREAQMRASRESSRATFAANDHVLQGWVWFSALDTRTCPVCWSQHGSFHQLGETMSSHVNCFPAGTEVVAGSVLCATARRYVGDLIEIRTAGHLVSVTPNHPILSPKGWVTAGSLNEGDYVLGGANAEAVVAAVHPDDYEVPALIEDVFETFGRKGGVGALTVPVSPKDFHGDGLGSDVCVVRSDGLLRDSVGNSKVPDPGLEQLLIRRKDSVCLSGSRSGHLGFGLPGFASNSGVCGQCVGDSLLRGSGGGEESVGFDWSSARNPTLDQQSLDGLTGDGVALGEFLLGLSGLVTSNEIIGIRRYPADCHVYNLETADGWYVANGIVSHNCRCTMIPSVKGSNVTGGMLTGDEAFARRSPEEQRKILGPARFEMFQDGDVEHLADFVTDTHHKVWGDGLRLRTLRELRGTDEDPGPAPGWGPDDEPDPVGPIADPMSLPENHAAAILQEAKRLATIPWGEMSPEAQRNVLQLASARIPVEPAVPVVPDPVPVASSIAPGVTLSKRWNITQGNAFNDDGDLVELTAEESWNRFLAGMREQYGDDVTVEEVLEGLGIPDGSKVSLEEADTGSPALHASGEIGGDDFTMSRSFEGEIIHHVEFILGDNAPAGTGTKIFAGQVALYDRLGAKSIHTYAARGKDLNGYYTWPRLGFDASPEPRAELTTLTGLKKPRLSDLMKTQEGRDFWKAWGESMDMEFDLTPGSLSRKVLEAYLKAKAVGDS